MTSFWNVLLCLSLIITVGGDLYEWWGRGKVIFDTWHASPNCVLIFMQSAETVSTCIQQVPSQGYCSLGEFRVRTIILYLWLCGYKRAPWGLENGFLARSIDRMVISIVLGNESRRIDFFPWQVLSGFSNGARMVYMPCIMCFPGVPPQACGLDVN